jgi:diphthamide synthase (EF-2-diphthine--ammonia ligase)
MLRAVVSWSGGKDSCLACYKAASNGFKIKCLLNIITKESRVISHGLDSNLIAAQAEAIEIPIIKRETTWETYEKTFKETLIELKKNMHIEYAIFGDIHVQEHLDWVRRVCRYFDLCGEFGEYHTLVVDGPIFTKRLKIMKSGKTLKEGYWKYWLSDIYEYVLEDKSRNAE